MVKSFGKPLTVHSKPLMSPLQRYIISTSVHTMIVQRHLLAAKTACTSQQNVDCTVQLHKKGALQLNNMPTATGHPWLLAHWLDKKCIMMYPHKHYVRYCITYMCMYVHTQAVTLKWQWKWGKFHGQITDKETNG